MGKPELETIEKSEAKWTAEENGNYDPPWVIRYNPTPGGKKNANGSTTYSLMFPALQVTEWVGDPEQSAKDIANALNEEEVNKAMIADLVGALASLISTAEMLHEQCDGCAINHYGDDYAIQGIPGYIAAAKTDIDAAKAVVARAKTAEG